MKLQIRPLLALCLSVAGIFATPAASAGSKVAESDFWVSLGGGAYSGQDYDPRPGQPDRDSLDVGGYEAMLALTVAGDVLGRLRVGWMEGFTSNDAEEVSALLGLPLDGARKVYAAVGISRLSDVAEYRPSPTVGVPLELTYYPTRGLEFALHGNLNPDSDFIGVTIAGVFGKRRR